jgi:hypothetical protein
VFCQTSFYKYERTEEVRLLILTSVSSTKQEAERECYQ